MPQGKITAVLSCLVIVGALSAIFFTVHDFAPASDHRLHEMIGQALAKETLALLGNNPGPITVIARDTITFPQPAMAIAVESFKREIAKLHATIAAVEAIQVDPLRPALVPGGDFYELIRKAPPGSAIVSFLGPPLLSDAQRTQLGAIKPKIIAFCPGNLAEYVDLRSLFAARLLHAAVVAKPTRPGNADTATVPTSFEQLYESVTADNLGNLPHTPSTAQ